MKCNATDPRDEVYAVLSLMEPQARSLIPVDYSLDLDVVWRNAIAAIIITQGNLDILSHVGVYRHRSLLNNRVRRSYMNRVDIAGYLERVASSNSHHLTLPYSEGHRATPWRAQLVMPSNPSDIPQQSATFSIIGPPVNSNSLLPRFCVRAHYIDRIDVPMVFRPSLKKRKRGKDYGNDAVYYDWDQEPFDRIRSYSVRSLVAFFKADVDNVSTTDPHKPSHGTSGFHPGTVTSGSERPEALIMNDPSIEDTDLSEFIRICQTSRKGRPLFTSHFSVGFPGISSMKRIVQQGDEIFAIDGARTPFILRKRGRVAENYKIIDECYLWAALELDCWNPGTRKGRWGPGVERPTTTQTRMINIC
ncbi:het-domain-containing [Alternaria burnsii]|uniref:Het-domain-containing n=1 Tax=Alternaria burnsii TaxID=1187904 RepID=A0A8H7EA61_9PLEO|nr:het-domain-containing [Alternaria burnsii]KAF7672217.1 het-domain-containing [Alternaria burnsii]